MAVASNGAGDLLVLRPGSAEIEPWRHETRDVVPAAALDLSCEQATRQRVRGPREWIYDAAMTLEELMKPLPWGLHDACLESLTLDWPRARASLTVRLMTSERQDEERRAVIELTGLLFCSVDAPEIAPDRGYTPTPTDGLRIGDGMGAAPGAVLPAVPEGCFLHHLYVSDWNRFIHLCARHATLAWLDPAPVPARGRGRALYAGDEIPDP